MNKSFIFIVFILFLIVPNVSSYYNQGHIKLLAVSTIGDKEIGSVADLYLEIKKGTGRVFIDTYPLTKLDTQFSTRFAKSFACDYLDMDCSRYDFFYTIKAKSAIIGGPSAGAAITLLTISQLSKENFPKNTAITGTINSGGIIGPVAGIKAKIEAAQKDGLDLVFIPKLAIEKNNSNLTEFLENTSINVIKVSTIDEALFELTGKRFNKYPNVFVDDIFQDTMKDIAAVLCNETKNIIIYNTNTLEENRSKNLFQKGINATKNKTYYAAASYCFGANIEIRKLIFSRLSNDELYHIYLNLSKNIESLNKIINVINLKTVADLQTYMIVKERLIDASEYILELDRKNNFSNISSSRLAYSYERYNSALTWSKFFGTGKKQFNLNQEHLQETCMNKIVEVTTNLDYINLYINIPLESIEKEIDYANTDLRNEDYELCIFKASKAKAEISLILEALSIAQDQIKELVEKKIELTKKNIAKVQQKGFFPILGYSYFEYSKSLLESDPQSANLYIEYANELSNLNVYFETKSNKRRLDININYTITFFLGVLIGILITIIIFNPFKKNKSKKRR